MQVSMSAPVIGAVRLPESLSFKFDDGIEVIFLASEERLVKVTVRTSVPGEKNLHINTDEPSITIGAPASNQALHKLLALLRSIESNLSFQTQGAFRSLDMQSAMVQYRPEEPGEEDLVELMDMPFRWNYSTPGAEGTVELFQSVLDYRDAVEPLVVVKAFWREGRNDFLSGRYAKAFFNFYFVLEGLYGEGAFRKATLLPAFRSSSQLMACVHDFLKFTLNDTVNHARRLRELLATANLPENETGLLEFLIDTRNLLHHYFEGSTRRQPTPFNEDEYETVGWIMMLVATRIIEVRQNELIEQWRATTPAAT